MENITQTDLTRNRQQAKYFLKVACIAHSEAKSRSPEFYTSRDQVFEAVDLIRSYQAELDRRST